MAFFCVAFAVVCRVEAIADLISVFPNVKGAVTDYGISEANGKNMCAVPLFASAHAVILLRTSSSSVLCGRSYCESGEVLKSTHSSFMLFQSSVAIGRMVSRSVFSITILSCFRSRRGLGEPDSALFASYSIGVIFRYLLLVV